MFTDEMQKALKEDAQKLRSQGVDVLDPEFFNWLADITIIDDESNDATDE